MASGWNPVVGNDAGSRPPLGPRGLPLAQPGQPYIPHLGPGSQMAWPPAYWATAAQVPMPLSMSMPMPVPMPLQMGMPMPYGGPGQPMSSAYYPMGGQPNFGLQPNGMCQPFARAPQGLPRIDPSMPAAQLTNSTGGVGCEPGYNYFFPATHTKVHVVKSRLPPWTLPDNAQAPFMASHVPCSVRISELMRGFGCNNPVAKLNCCYEIVPGGNGRWYRGVSFSGDDKDKMRKTMLEVGWDATRTGAEGQKPPVWLWFTKG